MTTTLTPTRGTAVEGRPPLAPRAVFPVLDRLLHARPAPVIGLRYETPTVLSVEIGRPPGFRYRAGQYAMLRLQTESGPDMRPLSIASWPDEPTLRFATRLGPSAFKQALAGLEGGEMVKVSRAMGSFRLDRARPAVIVTGGIGVTPVRSMLGDAVTAGHDQPIRLLYGNRTADEIAFRHDLERLAARDPLLAITWALSGSATSGLPGAHRGRVDEHLLWQAAQELPDAVFYVTGPAAMVSDVTAALRALAVPTSRVRTSTQTIRADRAGRSH